MKGEEISLKGGNSIRASYGIMKILQFRHVAPLKHLFPSKIYRSLTVPRRRYRAGTPRLEEAELMSVMMQMLTRCVSDAVTSSDI
jgi:hypothetical protein